MDPSMLLVAALDAVDATREDAATALNTLDAKTMLAVCSSGPSGRRGIEPSHPLCYKTKLRKLVYKVKNT